MWTVVVVQHGEKVASPGDPGLTPRGVDQARRTALALQAIDSPSRLLSSPLRRARQTAEVLAQTLGLEVEIDDRLTERMNWDGRISFDDFLNDWHLTSTDRDYGPAVGDSSREAGRRFLEALNERCRGEGGLLVAVAHGGVTVDLLRTVAGDEAVEDGWPTLIHDGVPSCAVTRLSGTADGFQVESAADQSHL